MFPSFFSIFLSLLLVSVTFAIPVIQRDTSPVTLGFAHHVKALKGARNIAQIDRARAKKLVDNVSGTTDKTVSAVAPVSVGADNSVLIYTAQVGVGSPPTKCKYK